MHPIQFVGDCARCDALSLIIRASSILSLHALANYRRRHTTALFAAECMRVRVHTAATRTSYKQRDMCLSRPLA